MVNLMMMLATICMLSPSSASSQQVTDFETETSVISEHSNCLEQLISTYERTVNRKELDEKVLEYDEPTWVIQSHTVARIKKIDECFPFSNLVICKPFLEIKSDYDLIGERRFLEIYSTRITAECFFLHFYKKAKDLFALPNIALSSFTIDSVLKVYDQDNKEFSDVLANVAQSDQEQFIRANKPIGGLFFRRFSCGARCHVIRNSFGVTIRPFCGTKTFLISPNENIGEVELISASIIRQKSGTDLFEVLVMQVANNLIFKNAGLSDKEKFAEQRFLLNDLLGLNQRCVERRILKEVDNQPSNLDYKPSICKQGFYFEPQC